MKFRNFLEKSIDIHQMIKDANFKYMQTKCKNPIFRLYKDGADPYDNPSFVGNYDDTIQFLRKKNEI